MLMGKQYAIHLWRVHLVAMCAFVFIFNQCFAFKDVEAIKSINRSLLPVNQST